MTSIITETMSFGLQQGTTFNDAVEVGGFPGEQKIKGIKQIKLMQGWLVDGIQVTYQMTDGTTKVAPARGGGAGSTTVDFGANEVLVGVTGKLGIPNYYSNLPYLCALRLIIADTATGAVRVAGPYGYGAGADKYTGTSFTVAGNIIAFAGKSLTGSGDPGNAVTLSFIKSVNVDNNNGLVPV